MLAIFAGFHATAQKTTVADYEKVDVQVELLLDSAAKHMLLFIFTKNESEYNTALARIEEAEKLNLILEKKVDGLSGATLKTEKQELEDRKEEFESYHDPKLKSEIMKETDKERTTAVKFKGKAYNVGKVSKAKYDLFIAYLPRN